MSCQCICLFQKCSGKWTEPGVERWKTKDPETSLASWQCQQTLQRAPNIKHTHPGARTGNLSSLDLQRVRSGNPAVLLPREAHWRPGIQTERQRDGCEDFSQRPAVLELVRMVELGVQLVSDDIGWWWQVGLTDWVLGLKEGTGSTHQGQKCLCATPCFIEVWNYWMSKDLDSQKREPHI